MTACSSSNIELVWQNTSRSTLRPLNADFTYAAGKYDFLTCEFGSKTANKIRDNIEVLDRTHAVAVKLDGNTVRTMYFRPENVFLGQDYRESEYDGYLELHDLHEFFDSGAITKDYNNQPIRTIYTELYRKRQGEKDPFTDSFPRFVIDGGLTDGTAPDPEDPPEQENGFYDEDYEFHVANQGPFRERLDSERRDLDIKDESTVLEAIKRANNKLSLSTRISPEGDFVVGTHFGGRKWTASQTGSNVNYLIDSAGIEQGYKNQLERINVNGPIEVVGGVDGLGFWGGIGRAAGSLGSAANPLDEEEKSGYQLRAVVENTEVTNGQIFTVDMPEINPNEVDEIANTTVRAYREADSQKQTGTLKLDMSNSDTTAVPDIGDVISVPREEDCRYLEKPAYRADIFSISSVRHKVDSTWEMELEVTSLPVSRENLEFRIGYIDNATDNIYTYENVQGYQADPQSVAYGGTITDEDTA